MGRNRSRLTTIKERHDPVGGPWDNPIPARQTDDYDHHPDA